MLIPTPATASSSAQGIDGGSTAISNEMATCKGKTMRITLTDLSHRDHPTITLAADSIEVDRHGTVLRGVHAVDVIDWTDETLPSAVTGVAYAIDTYDAVLVGRLDWRIDVSRDVETPASTGNIEDTSEDRVTTPDGQGVVVTRLPDVVRVRLDESASSHPGYCYRIEDVTEAVRES